MVGMGNAFASLRRGCYYALAAALVSGAIGFVTLGLVVPQDERFTNQWWIALAVETSLFGVIGFMLGTLAPQSKATKAQTQQNPREEQASAGGILSGIGSVFYRFVVGALIGFLVASVFSALVVAVGYAFQIKLPESRQGATALILVMSLLWAGCGAWSGAICGAVFATQRSPCGRPKIARWAVLGSLFGILVAAEIGGSVAGIAGFERFHEVTQTLGENATVLIVFLAACLAGVPGGICAAVMSRFRQ